MSRAEDPDLVHECRQFRICIIGKAGVGKSTLLAKVFGFSDATAGVIGREGGRGIHNVWTPIQNRERNAALVIHDSGGFEAGEGDNLRAVKEFIEWRGRQSRLSEQLHCIWYCISLADDRPIQAAEEDFFRFFEGKAVPLVFVLTKFDKLVRDIQDEQAWDESVSSRQARKEALREAKSHVERMRGRLERATGRGVKVQEISNKDPVLVERLIRETSDIVKPNLINVWIRAQGILAQHKREACIRELPRYFKDVFVALAIPFFGPLRPVTLESQFERMFHHCMAVWNLPGQETIFTHESIVSIFRDSMQSYIALRAFAASLDFSGPLTAPLYTRLMLKTACDMVLVFQQLFWTTTKRTGLSMAELERQLKIYKESDVRKSVHRHVDGSMGVLDVVRAFQVKEIQEILENAVNTGQRVVLEGLKKRGVKNGDGIPLAELPA